MEHGNSFRGLNFFGQIIIDAREISTEYRNRFIVASFQGVKLSELQL
jgi:hypothetical protein